MDGIANEKNIFAEALRIDSIFYVASSDNMAGIIWVMEESWT